jgi:hypothetical protein
MPAFHPVGELPIDRDEQKVLCGLCGRWFRALGSHLGAAHGWTAHDYRRAFGLNVQRPLQAPAVSERQAENVRRRLKTDPRLRTAMSKGLAMARSGELNELGRLADRRRGRSTERVLRTARQGQQLGRERAARFKAVRDGRARGLGYADSEDLIRRLYLHQGASVADLALALGCAEITVTDEMDRLDLSRRPQDARLARGRQVLAARRAQRRAEEEARARRLGFPDLESYLRVRHHELRWPRRLIAEELGITVPVVARLMRQEGVPALRGLTVATARGSAAKRS